MTDILKPLRDAAEAMEEAMKSVEPQSKAHAKLLLAWHHVLDAYALIIKGEMTPDDLSWAWAKVRGRGK